MKIVAALMALLAVGCAKLPDSGTSTRSTRIVVTMTMDQPINRNFVYIVAFRPSTESNPTTTGPIPVIAPPWGNGFVAGNATNFVRWDPLQSPAYIVYRFNDQLLNAYFPTGAPINYIDVGQNGNQIRFELDLTQLAATPAEAQTFRSLQINMFTQDRVPQGSSGSKDWDALGDGRLPSTVNDYITVDLLRNGLYNNQRQGNLEPVGDVRDPALDIADWSVEVRIQ